MKCCGHQRLSRPFSSPHPHSFNASSLPAAPTPPDHSAREFEYTGKTALTVIGPSTWRRYYFESPGAILSIDADDAPAMAFVPFLKQI